MSGDLDDAARERADQVREKRHERADPEGRVGRLQAHVEAADEFDLPGADADSPGDLELPEPVREAFEDTRKKLTYGLAQEFDVNLDPEDHYWPLVVHLGVERINGMWLAEVRRTLENVEGIDPPE